MTLILAEATSIVDAAIAKARQLDVNVSVTVCDENGRLIAFKRMDGVPAEADRLSIGKAVASEAPGSRAARSRVPSIIRRSVPSSLREGRRSTFGADCRFSETARSRAPAGSPERYPTSKRKIAHEPGLPASDGDLRRLRLCRVKAAAAGVCQCNALIRLGRRGPF